MTAHRSLSLLETRRSGKPRELVGPGPTREELERILTIAARTPDHGKLTPVALRHRRRRPARRAWRAAPPGACRGRSRCAPPAKHEKEDEFAHYAGQLVVLISAPVEDHKIPVWEQELSCGAAGMNLLLAAHALGYVAGWVTGWRAYSERVRAAFCGPGERIAGFIFIGHAGARARGAAAARSSPTSWKPWQPPNS